MGLISKISRTSGITKNELRIIWPVFIEMLAGNIVSIVATVVITGIGGFAISGIGLADSVNFILIGIFQSVSTGITVITAQYIGRGDTDSARESGVQSITLAVLITIILSSVVLVFRNPILNILFGEAQGDVLKAADSFLLFNLLSFPFLAYYSVITGILRAAGNSKIPMIGSLTTNIVYIGLSVLLINTTNLGITGVGIGLLSGRILSALLMYVYMKINQILPKEFSLKLNMKTLRPVLKIAIPSGVDSLLFNCGIMIVSVFMSSMGTIALTANAISNSILGFICLSGNTISVASSTIVGQNYGSGDTQKTKKSINNLTLIAMVLHGVFSLICALFLKPIISIYSPTAETAVLVKNLAMIFLISAPLLWAPSFVTPQSLRATGDVTFTMVVSLIGIFGIRVLGTWVLGIYLGMGMVGSWFSMCGNWLMRSFVFTLRAVSGKWNKDTSI